jgi:hypothetical protein
MRALRQYRRAALSQGYTPIMASRGASQADAFLRATLSIGDELLRPHYVATVARAWPIEDFAHTLDVLCQRAEQAEVGAREALVAVVDALNAEGTLELVHRLQELASHDSMLALERLVRTPGHGFKTGPSSGAPREALEKKEKVAIRSEKGRPLTLGERKSLARRPDRETMRRLLTDPHPDVIRRCLRNPRMTEDDLLPLVARRPGRGEVLAEVARSRWVHRPRVRLALVLNPATPLEIAVRIAGLLLRPELDMVATSPGVPGALRAICLEHLARRPPAGTADEGEGVH